MARRRSLPLPEFTPHPATTPPENPDLIDQLSFEHRQLRRLWSELQLAHRRHVEEPHRPGARLGLTGQRDVGSQIVRILAQHEARELELLYPIAGPIVGEDWVEHAKADHDDVRDLLDEVDGENPEDDGVFDIYLDVMTRTMTHIDEEENVVFPMLRTALPPSELANPGHIDTTAPEPHPDVIDLAADERQMAAAGTPAGNGGNGGNGREGRSRLRLRRR